MALLFLPVELVENIFSYLEIADILNMRRIHPRFAAILDGRPGTVKARRAHLHNDFDLTEEDLDFLSQPPIARNIISLNISGVHWIDSRTLHGCIGMMENLEELYAVDTKLQVYIGDMLLYINLSKLKRLAISIKCNIPPTLRFPALTYMCLHVNSDIYPEYTIVILQLLHYTRRNQEVWIYEVGAPKTDNENLRTTNIVCSAAKMRFYPEKYKCCRYSRTFTSMPPIVPQPFKKLHQDLRAAYNFPEYDTNWTYVPKEQYRLPTFPENELRDAELDEMNVCHSTRCSEGYEVRLGNVLLENRMKNVRKLALNYCSCLLSSTRGMFRSRSCLLYKVVMHATDIEELELWKCNRMLFRRNVLNGGLENIARLKNLRRLTLDDLPPTASAAFLNKVFLKCKRLSSLRIKSKNGNTGLDMRLCKALQHATHLEELRYVNPGDISINTLLRSLIVSNNVQWKRIYIKCKSIKTINKELLTKFLQMNTGLIFFDLIIKNIPDRAVSIIFNCFDVYKDDLDKYLIFNYCDNWRQLIKFAPHVHVHQMVMYGPRVSTYDVFTDFRR